MLTETSAQKVVAVGITGTILGYTLPEFVALVASILTALYMLMQCVIALPKAIETVKQWRAKRNDRNKK